MSGRRFKEGMYFGQSARWVKVGQSHPTIVGLIFAETEKMSNARQTHEPTSTGRRIAPPIRSGCRQQTHDCGMAVSPRLAGEPGTAVSIALNRARPVRSGVALRP